MQVEQICKGISQRRKQLGLSQEELARMIGVTRQAVSRWESGSALPSVDNMIELSRALQISVDELLQLTMPQEFGLSAQSVGVLLDEYAARQEKRIKRLTLALSVIGGILLCAVLLTALLGQLRTHRMQQQINAQINATNTQLASSINSLNARINTTVQHALDEGVSRLTDCRATTRYDHAACAYVMELQAYPQQLVSYSDAQFAFVKADGTRFTTPAELTDGAFRGSISIPDYGQERISGNVYISWTEDGSTVTEAIPFYDVFTQFDRLVITNLWMDTRSQQEKGISVRPWCAVFLSYEARDTLPAHIRYDVYDGDTLAASYEQDWNVLSTRNSSESIADTVTHTPSDYIPLENVSSTENLLLRVTVTDAIGRDFIHEYRPETK